MAYNKTIWENLPSTNTPINQTNLNKIENELINAETERISLNTTMSELLTYQDININIKTASNVFIYESGNFTIPNGYSLLTAMIIGNGYISEVLPSIISLSNSQVVVNAYSSAVRDAIIKVRVIFIKDFTD